MSSIREFQKYDPYTFVTDIPVKSLISMSRQLTKDPNIESSFGGVLILINKLSIVKDGRVNSSFKHVSSAYNKGEDVVPENILEDFAAQMLDLLSEDPIGIYPYVAHKGYEFKKKMLGNITVTDLIEEVRADLSLNQSKIKKEQKERQQRYEQRIQQVQEQRKRAKLPSNRNVRKHKTVQEIKLENKDAKLTEKRKQKEQKFIKKKAKISLKFIGMGVPHDRVTKELVDKVLNIKASNSGFLYNNIISAIMLFMKYSPKKQATEIKNTYIKSIAKKLFSDKESNWKKLTLAMNTLSFIHYEKLERGFAHVAATSHSGHKVSNELLEEFSEKILSYLDDNPDKNFPKIRAIKGSDYRESLLSGIPVDNIIKQLDSFDIVTEGTPNIKLGKKQNIKHDLVERAKKNAAKNPMQSFLSSAADNGSSTGAEPNQPSKHSRERK